MPRFRVPHFLTTDPEGRPAPAARALVRLREFAGIPASQRPQPRLTRAAAVLAAVSTVLGAVAVVVAVSASRRLWFGGYVSEAGVGADAGGYRFGMISLAAGLVLLAVALAAILPVVAALLAAGGLLAGLSGSVPCSEGCPLPPYQSPTAADLVHAAASILAVGLIVLAMIALAAVAADPLLRRISRAAAAVIVPVLAVMGMAMLAVGRGHLTGLLERAVLTFAAAWALTMCAHLSRPFPAPKRSLARR